MEKLIIFMNLISSTVYMYLLFYHQQWVTLPPTNHTFCFKGRNIRNQMCKIQLCTSNWFRPLFSLDFCSEFLMFCMLQFHSRNGNSLSFLQKVYVYVLLFLNSSNTGRGHSHRKNCISTASFSAIICKFLKFMILVLI